MSQPPRSSSSGQERSEPTRSTGSLTFSKSQSVSHQDTGHLLFRSQMISQDDFTFISRFDGANHQERERIVTENPMQVAKTFHNLLGHISKDQTIQYLLTLVDDFLQEDKNRVNIFRDFAKKRRESVWANFLNLLNRPDGFIQNMTARIVAKMACWMMLSGEVMAGSDLQYYLTWLKDQLRMTGNDYVQSVARCLQMMLR